MRNDATCRYLLQRFPYIVVYMFVNDRVWVIAIAHCKRQPGHWSERVSTAEQPAAPGK